MNRSTVFARGMLTASIAAVVACSTVDKRPSDTAAAPAADATPRVVTVNAADFAFESPDTIPAGMTTIRLVNGGTELHHVQLFRLTDGHTQADLIQAMSGREGPLPAWVIPVGGPNSPGPAGQAEATLHLEPGNYVMICVIPSADGVVHARKGMMRPLAVTAAAIDAPDVAPAADITMKLVDYAFDMPATIRPGRHTIRVENAAAQPHEVFIVQLAPGKTAQDMIEFVSTMKGEPPGRPVGGTTSLATSGVNYITVDLPAGEYALLCFVPDAKDGKPHIAHGMIRQFTIAS